MLLAHTFNIGTGELAVVLLVALVVFGPNKLPEVARQAGRAMRTFRKISDSFRKELRDAMAQPIETNSEPGVQPIETNSEPGVQPIETNSEPEESAAPPAAAIVQATPGLADQNPAKQNPAKQNPADPDPASQPHNNPASE